MKEKQHSTKNPRKDTAQHFFEKAIAEESEALLKYKLTLANRIIAMEDLDEGGISGHISVKVPNSNDLFWVNPFGFLGYEVTPENLIKVNKDGKIVEGAYPVNVAGFFIHSIIHEMYPGVNCIVHTHSPWGTIFSALDMTLDPIDQNCCMFFENYAIYDQYSGPVIDIEDSEALAATIGDNSALILRNHGSITCGESIETAVMYMVSLERALRINILAKKNGNIRTVTPDVARSTREWIANPIGFKIEFNALARKAELKYPDLLAFKP